MKTLLSTLFVAALTMSAESSLRTTGSPNAPITIEVFSDFQCPHCKLLHFGALKEAAADCVAAGKVKIVNRDYPLPQHPYSKLAASYAIAASRIGKYERVCDELFREQNVWGANGNVDATVAAVLTKVEMDKIRRMIVDPRTLAGIEGEIAQDKALGNKIPLQSTPTMILTYKGKTYPMVGDVRYDLMKRLIDNLLAK